MAAWHDVLWNFRAANGARTDSRPRPASFARKAYAVDPEMAVALPDGEDAGVSVHPINIGRATRFTARSSHVGETKRARATANPELDARLTQFDAKGYTVIPFSGKFATYQGIAIHHRHARLSHPALLPVEPTPTVFARFGRFGSPYASQDLTGNRSRARRVDQRTHASISFANSLTPRTRAVGVCSSNRDHHTGWGARLQELHPNGIARREGKISSAPARGARSGKTSADSIIAALRSGRVGGNFSRLCRRGVDGFRCDAGYNSTLRGGVHSAPRARGNFLKRFSFSKDSAALGIHGEIAHRRRDAMGLLRVVQNYSGIGIASYSNTRCRKPATRPLRSL